MTQCSCMAVYSITVFSLVPSCVHSAWVDVVSRIQTAVFLILLRLCLLRFLSAVRLRIDNVCVCSILIIGRPLTNFVTFLSAIKMNVQRCKQINTSRSNPISFKKKKSHILVNNQVAMKLYALQ